MKKLTILSLLFLFQPLYSIDISKLYQELKPLICKHESIVPCNKDSFLVHNKNYFKLDNNKILVFFNIFNSKSLSYQYGTENGAIIFDSNGGWQIINHIFSGAINEIKRDVNGGIWVSHPWMIEGTSPALSYSRNGLKWIDIKLPPKENLYPIFTLDFSLLHNKIALRFDDSESEKIYWVTNYKDAIKTHPKWKKIRAKEYIKQRSLTATEINNFWSLRDSKNELLFYNSINGNSLYLPNKINRDIKSNNTKYSIQIGFFNLEKNLNIAYKELKSITDYALISKKISYSKYKLFLGSFTTKKEAKNTLEKLKSRYRKNRYIDKAFITVLP